MAMATDMILSDCVMTPTKKIKYAKYFYLLFVILFVNISEGAVLKFLVLAYY